MGEGGLLLLLGKLGLAVRRCLTRVSVQTRDFESCNGVRGRILSFSEDEEEGPQSRLESLLLKDPREKRLRGTLVSLTATVLVSILLL